jgi:hypothetical protein
MVLLLSTVGVLCCLAAAIGVWIFYQHASQRVQNITARLDVGLERASVANQNAQRAMANARAEVAKVGKESTDVGGGGERSRGASRALRTLIQQHVGPNLSDLRGRLATLSDAAVAVSTLLQSFQELPASRTGRIKPDELARWGDEAQQLSGTLRRLEASVGNGEKATNSGEVAAATSEVDLILQKCQARTDLWQSDLDGAREDLRHLKAEILGWLTPAAIVGTILCLWVAAGQVSLFAHALRWCRGD